MMGEVFGAESKSQVYGHLHAFFYDNENATTSLSKQIIIIIIITMMKSITYPNVYHWTLDIFLQKLFVMTMVTT